MSTGSGEGSRGRFIAAGRVSAADGTVGGARGAVAAITLACRSVTPRKGTVVASGAVARWRLSSAAFALDTVDTFLSERCLHAEMHE